MAGYLKEVNIKADLPTVSEALKRIESQIKTGKSLGTGAIKIIHGYGSTGKGGKIRHYARLYLEEQREKGRIRHVITGEKFSIFDGDTREAFRHCDELRRDSDLERHNNGVTIIVL